MIPSLFVRGEARSNDLQCRVRWPFLFGEAGRDLVHTHDKEAFMVQVFKRLSFPLAVAVLGATLLIACGSSTSRGPGTKSASPPPHTASVTLPQGQDLEIREKIGHRGTGIKSIICYIVLLTSCPLSTRT